jgi:hypothetical protein
MLGMDFSRLRSQVEATFGLTLGSGRVFFVGSSTDRWFVEEMVNNKLDGTVRTSLNSAVEGCEHGRGDIIVVLPGTHSVGGTMAPREKSRIVGLPGMREATRVIGPASQTFIEMDNSQAIIEGLTFGMIAGESGIVVTAESCAIRDCAFIAVSGAPTNYITVDGTVGDAGDGLVISGCKFDTSAVSAISFVADANGQINAMTVADCVIGGATNGVLLPTHNATNIVITNNHFVASTNPINCTATKTGIGSIISGNNFAIATTNDCTSAALHASYLWVGNFSLAGLSTANPTG